MQYLVIIFLALIICSCSDSDQSASSQDDPFDDILIDSLAHADSLVQDSLRQDSLLRDSLVKDSLFKDSLFRDSLFKDSLVRDSLLKDSLARADSLAKIEQLHNEGMRLIKAKGNSVELGTMSTAARAIEQPAMKATFDYDYYISRHETTCGEFNSLMKPITALALECEKDSLPVVNVSYYDAILYANERSKKADLDTAYTYASVKFDSEKHCISLEGLAFHPEVESYHLPTEAEWTFAATSSWNAQRAWTADNSDYQLHPVCSKAKKDELCDMMGNVMEWANDWLGMFRDTTVQNFVGAPDGGTLGQRIVKGGSYRNKASSITLYGRGDVYTVTSSMRADYVGFRLALGSIAQATWMGNDGSAKESRVIPQASISTINAITGTYKAKLAFRNDITGNLAYVDYSSGILSVVEIEDSIDVFHPDISPDGEHVAFCTGLEGISGKSTVYVRDLNAEGSNLVKLDVENAAIPRWRVLESGDTAIVYVTDAGNNKDAAAFRSASTWQVAFANGQFGIPEKLFDGAYHGGISDDNRLAVTGARQLRAKIADPGSTLWQSARDTLWYNGEQACNASLSKDGRKQTLFLDFGGKTGRDYVGERYATHERLLVVDSTGKLVQSVSAPSGYLFDHSEWAGTHNLATASLTDANGAHKKIVLVNLSDSSVVDLAEGDELWHPCLWTNQGKKPSTDEDPEKEVDPSLDLDSAGAYLSENHNYEQAMVRIKMECFWKKLDSTKVFLAGSSRMAEGANPDMYPEWGMLNFAVPGIDPSRDFYFIKNYALNHSEHLKAIAISIDLDAWRGDENHLSLVLDYAMGYAYDANHSFWKDSIPTGFVNLVENAYPAEATMRMNVSSRGGMPSLSNGWETDGVEVLWDSIFTDKQMAYFDARIEELQEIVEIAAKKDIYVIGIIFPQAPQYKETGAFGLYGMQRSVAQNKIAYLDSIANVNQHFVLMDENKMGDHDYTDEMARNNSHLSSVGAKQLTSRLDSLLKTLIPDN
ncbi:MAG: TIGR02171 family protein [Fibrobacter sp.]|nr:TIGR02171 family protein [Fibrobacter sp.]